MYVLIQIYCYTRICMYLHKYIITRMYNYKNMLSYESVCTYSNILSYESVRTYTQNIIIPKCTYLHYYIVIRKCMLNKYRTKVILTQIHYLKYVSIVSYEYICMYLYWGRGRSCIIRIYVLVLGGGGGLCHT